MHVADGEGFCELERNLHETRHMAVEQIAIVPELFQISCEPLVVGGCPPDAILDAAAAHKADLVVVGAPSGWTPRQSGRTVRSLIRNAPSPVLVVGQLAAAPYGGSWYRSILRKHLRDQRGPRHRSSSWTVRGSPSCTHSRQWESRSCPASSLRASTSTVTSKTGVFYSPQKSKISSRPILRLIKGGRGGSRKGPRRTSLCALPSKCLRLSSSGHACPERSQKALFGSVIEDIVAKGGADVLVIPLSQPDLSVSHKTPAAPSRTKVKRPVTGRFERHV